MNCNTDVVEVSSWSDDLMATITIFIYTYYTVAKIEHFSGVRGKTINETTEHSAPTPVG